MALGDFVASLAADPGASSLDAIKQRQLLAQQLMQQGGSGTPIQSPWQGLNRLAQGLIGGYQAGQSDREAADWTRAGNDAFTKALSSFGSPTAAPATSSGTASDTPNLPAFAGGGKPMTLPGYSTAYDPAATETLIRQKAPQYGIDPDTAVKVAKSEGLNAYTGDSGSSFGPLQLHYGNIASGGNAVGGLGDEFTKATGLDARDPSTVPAQIDFALAHVAKNGWGAFHGAANSGIDNFAGIGQPAASAPVQVASNNPTQAMALAAPAAATPAAAAIAGASPTASPAASAGSQPIAVPGYDGQFTRDQANDAEGVPSQAEWDAAAKAAGTGAASPSPQVAAAAPIAPPAAAGTRAAVDPRQAQILSAMADPHITPAQRQVLGLLYSNMQKNDQWSAPAKDADGNLVSRNGTTGETKILVAAKDNSKTHVVGGALVDDKGKVIYNGSDIAPDEKMIDFAANRLLAGDSSALTNLGRGAQSGKVVQSILKRAQEISEGKGMDNAAAAQDILQKKADQMGRGAAARTGGTLNARMDVFSAEASSAMDLALETSRNLPRTSFLPLNKAIQTLEKGAGSPELAQHVAQTNAVINTYAKAINPTGVPTQSDKDHAREQLNAAQSPEAYEATIRQMQREINVAHRAARSVKDLGGAEIPPPPPTTTPSEASGAQSHGVWDAVKGMFSGSTTAPTTGAKRFKYDAQGNPVPQ